MIQLTSNKQEIEAYINDDRSKKEHIKQERARFEANLAQQNVKMENLKTQADDLTLKR